MLNESELIGKRVRKVDKNTIGIIQSIENGKMLIDFHGSICKYPYPQAFSENLELEDEDEQVMITDLAEEAGFDDFKKRFKRSIENEIDFLKKGGGKKYRLIEGIKASTKRDENLYAFETDVGMNLPDGTAIKLWFPDKIVPGYVVSCEDFMIFIRVMEDLGPGIESVEMSYEQWRLLETLTERIEDMNPDEESLAYELACKGRRKITEWEEIKKGQEEALSRAINERITFIWGPPGTGKTETLANIAIHLLESGKRVLMLSYSNVSVDGATLRVARKSADPEGRIVRYGYPRMQELLDHGKLTTYQYILSMNPELAAEYKSLVESKKRLRRNDPLRKDLNNKIKSIRESLVHKEQELVHSASFIATTVSKATIDPAIYEQRFDAVIFDEASMAYVPQIVFAAGLARDHFVCLGDFRQLPAIVQNKSDDLLSYDIFDHTGIVYAVDHDCNHEWLIMLDVQHRMHKDISDFASRMMYNNLLKTADDIIEDRAEIAANSPCSNAAMSIVDLSHMYSTCTRTMDGSRINPMSALISLRLAERYMDRYDVGIITPYNAQSRLLMSMIRDASEKDEKWSRVISATVHQFQGSEKSVIIYDAVDCFRMRYPGTLLTSLANDTANRLFNVALTRARGKFILVENMDFFRRKELSPKLIFGRAMDTVYRNRCILYGNSLVEEIHNEVDEEPVVLVETNDQKCLHRFINDLESAEKSINIDIPSAISSDSILLKNIIDVLDEKIKTGVRVSIRVPNDMVTISREYIKADEYVVHPITVIDKKIIWFGQLLENAHFHSEKTIIKTEYYPCIRFEGIHGAKSLNAFLK